MDESMDARKLDALLRRIDGLDDELRRMKFRLERIEQQREPAPREEDGVVAPSKPGEAAVDLAVQSPDDSDEKSGTPTASQTPLPPPLPAISIPLVLDSSERSMTLEEVLLERQAKRGPIEAGEPEVAPLTPESQASKPMTEYEPAIGLEHPLHQFSVKEKPFGSRFYEWCVKQCPPLKPLLDWFVPAEGEHFSIDEILVRVFAVVGVMAAVIAGGYFSTLVHNRIPPIGKVGLMYAAAAGMFVTGWRMSEQLRKLARPMMAGGVAIFYFTSYAAHFIEATHAFNLPVSLTLMTVALVGMIALAERLRSEMLAIFTVFLGYLTAYVSGSSEYALIANGSIAIAAMVFLMRNGWARLSEISVIGTYVFHLVWMFFWDHPPTTPQQAFLLNMGTLLGYFVVHLFGAMTADAARGGIEPWKTRRLLYLAWNAMIFWSVSLIVFQETRIYLDHTEWLHFALAAVLLLSAAWYRRISEDAFQLLLGLSLTLATIGVMTACSGNVLYLALMAEGAALLFVGKRAKLSQGRYGGVIVLLIAAGSLLAHQFTHVEHTQRVFINWRDPHCWAALFGCVTLAGLGGWYQWLYGLRKTHQPEESIALDSEDQSSSFSFSSSFSNQEQRPAVDDESLPFISTSMISRLLIYLSVPLFMIVSFIYGEVHVMTWLPLIGLAFLLAGIALRHPPYLVSSLGVLALHGLAGLILINADPGELLIKEQIAGIALVLACGALCEWRLRDVTRLYLLRLVDRLAYLPMFSFAALSCALMLEQLEPHWCVGSLAIFLAALLGVGWGARCRSLTDAAIVPFAVLSLRIMYEIYHFRTGSMALVGFQVSHGAALLMLFAATHFTEQPFVRERLRGAMMAAQWIAALLVCAPAAVGIVYFTESFAAVQGVILAAACGAVLALFMGWRRSIPLSLAGWLWLAYGHALYQLRLSNDAFAPEPGQPIVICLAALLAITIAVERTSGMGLAKWIEQAPEAETPQQIQRFLNWALGGAIAIALLHGLYAHPALHPAFVTVSWTLSGLALCLLGALLRVRLYPRAGFALLLCAIFRAFIVDVTQLEQTLHRMIAFLVLGVILMGVSYGYMKLKSRIDAWR
ncbi:DUF2339 domain-containing protein [Candidatus Sumerlaeota bacterium]|nr:DUF2339 domain-containing protein [Candidatus Sumerlaeota bacterium]